MSDSLTKSVPESLLARAWRHLALPDGAGASGEPLRVVFPGAPNPGAGPDFTGAILSRAGGELVTGDIEIDLSRSFWKGHGHDANPGYRGVMLRVVPRPPGAGPDRPPGRGPPVLEVGLPPPGAHPFLLPKKPCPGAARGAPSAVARLVGWAGDLRFRTKVQRFYRSMERAAPGQVLYEGLMESLGYNLNQLSFRRLALRLPLRQLCTLASAHPGLRLEALLLGSAGLLPSQAAEQSKRSSSQAVQQSAVSSRGGKSSNVRICNLQSVRGESSNLESGIWNPSAAGYIDHLEREWASRRRRALLRRADWHFFKVRPANSPPRRLAAAAHLLAETWLPDPAAALLPSVLDSPAALERSLAAPAGDYWRDHLDFGVPATPGPGLLGLGRRRDIVVNIILPFYSALGSLRGERRLRSRSLELFNGYGPGADNHVLRFMRERPPGLTPEPKARQQQGLLHLYHCYCRQGRCGYCPLLRGPALSS